MIYTDNTAEVTVIQISSVNLKNTHTHSHMKHNPILNFLLFTSIIECLLSTENQNFFSFITFTLPSILPHPTLCAAAPFAPSPPTSWAKVMIIFPSHKSVLNMQTSHHVSSIGNHELHVHRLV
jgi:hypothetical protein